MITAQDVNNIYEIPLRFHEQNVDEILVEKLCLEVPPADLDGWREVVERNVRLNHEPDGVVQVAVVGKYVGYADAYKSINEALHHAGLKNLARVDIMYVDSEQLVADGVAALDQADAILVPGGFGDRGIEGKIMAARYAREHKCLTWVSASVCRSR